MNTAITPASGCQSSPCGWKKLFGSHNGPPVCDNDQKSVAARMEPTPDHHFHENNGFDPLMLNSATAYAATRMRIRINDANFQSQSAPTIVNSATVLT